ncbi:MAG: PEP-CTERM sorting domain-containing protein [Candidatus Sulfotelmatobacter sp.]
MKRFLIILGVVLSAMPALANSIGFNGTGSYAQTVAEPGVESYIYGYNYQSTPTGYSNMEFEVWNCCGGSSSMTNFASGVLMDQVVKGGNSIYLYGDLFNSTFNTKTDVLTAMFSGWEESDQKGQWTSADFTGIFTEHVNTNFVSYNQNGLTEINGNLGNGTLTGLPGGSYSPLPEPGSLALMGTGLVCMGGFVRRKLRI